MCDLTVDRLSDTIPHDVVDLASLFFVLSAISPEKMTSTLKNIYSVRGSITITCTIGFIHVCTYAAEMGLGTRLFQKVALCTL